VVLELEEAEAQRLGAREGRETRPEAVEERARLEGGVDAVTEGVLEAALRLAEDRVDEDLLALEEAVERPSADPRPLHHGWNRCSMVSALGEELESGLENAGYEGLPA
jgi:hypothetical protein